MFVKKCFFIIVLKILRDQERIDSFEDRLETTLPYYPSSCKFLINSEEKTKIENIHLIIQKLKQLIYLKLLGQL